MAKLDQKVLDDMAVAGTAKILRHNNHEDRTATLMNEINDNSKVLRALAEHMTKEEILASIDQTILHMENVTPAFVRHVAHGKNKP